VSATSVTETSRAEAPRLARRLLGALALALATTALFAPARHNGFVAYDDDVYLTENPIVGRGLTAAGVRWAFTTTHASNWHPLTWLSHMLDVELFGMDPAAHHLVGAALHGLNAALLLLALTTLTGRLVPSAVVALFFALHPLRVESVAWASERKDLLAGLFWMLTLLAYAGWARRGGALRYTVLLVSFAAGLLAKPMLVSLPAVLLLLDGWPLRRLGTGWSSVAPALLEKLPLFVLALASCLVTPLAQAEGNALRDLAAIGWDDRLANALVATVRYVGLTLWPANLSVFHPHPALVTPGWSPLGAAPLGAGALLLAASGLAWRRRRRSPWLLVGWGWTLVSLAPVIGIVQVGEQALAERYTYLPTVGLFLALVWSIDRLLASRPRLYALALPVGLAVALAWALASARRIRDWRDTETLFESALAATEKNYVAHNNLGLVHLARGEGDDARRHFEAALELRPADPKFHLNVAQLDRLDGRFDDAEAGFRRALALREDLGGAHAELGLLRFLRGDPDEALVHMRRAVELRPTVGRYRANLGTLLYSRGELAAAERQLERAVELDRSLASAFERLGVVRVARGRFASAAAALERALELDPSLPQATERLAWVLATSAASALRDGERALVLARRAASLGIDERRLTTLAAAHAAVGQFDEAVDRETEALAHAPFANRGEHEARLELYRAGRALELEEVVPLPPGESDGQSEGEPEEGRDGGSDR